MKLTPNQFIFLRAYKPENNYAVRFCRDGRVLLGLYRRGFVKDLNRSDARDPKRRWRFRFTPKGKAMAAVCHRLRSDSPLYRALMGLL